ncbi:O-methyltransferase [Colletotrichum karsti]|uniref:O-methyltransferase n=1 Tax=Colletotrichum karsti TaxID=1095194 RepID=A0A9P6HYY4_9PEZI|nr:O-methyltransferase [Colletotrichum karsti]KAF9870936.1 O-methyltransferase [Colletotrichum karsti]
MAITPDELPGLVSQLSALVNSPRQGGPTLEMERIAEKILYATRPLPSDPMHRMFPYVDLVLIRLFIDWKVFETIPLDGAISYAQLAKAVDADESILRRYASFLVSRHILVQEDGDRIAHTDVSKLYLPGRQEFNLFTFYYDEMFLSCVKKPEYYAHYGRQKTLWEIAHSRPERLKRVMEAMDTVQHGPMIARTYDFSWLREKLTDPQHQDRIAFVDVGGGKGHMIKDVMRGNPFMPANRMALEDRDEVMKEVAINREPELEGVKLQSHDFHKEQPIKNAFIYFICRCLHNYSDEVSGKMLTHISNAMAPDSRVVIAEMVMEDPPEPLQAMYDFTMIDIGGKERTAKGWSDLAASAGLKVSKIFGSSNEMKIVECVKI